MLNTFFRKTLSLHQVWNVSHGYLATAAKPAEISGNLYRAMFSLSLKPTSFPALSPDSSTWHVALFKGAVWDINIKKQTLKKKITMQNKQASKCQKKTPESLIRSYSFQLLRGCSRLSGRLRRASMTREGDTRRRWLVPRKDAALVAVLVTTVALGQEDVADRTHCLQRLELVSKALSFLCLRT